MRLFQGHKSAYPLELNYFKRKNPLATINSEGGSASMYKTFANIVLITLAMKIKASYKLYY